MIVHNRGTRRMGRSSAARKVAAPYLLAGRVGREEAHDTQEEVAGRPDPQLLPSLRLLAAKHPLTFVAHLSQSNPEPILGFTP